MPKIRGAAGTTINTSVVITVCAFVLLMVAVFLQRELRRKRRTQYHPPLQLETTSGGVLEQIGRRKEDIRRYIDKLKEQLAVREDQLRYHNELEEIVTSRVETSRVDEEEWTNLMKAGRKLHGKKWNASNGDEPSLM
ncbi:hypothetical protein PHYBOEH_005681 [Phytophthora boehmeriae]|uniref:Uncharacterized protein n=1 Tax=Phytophthora boehmeriae TaxID=109152 RepID=A0A8T1XCW4_9STRA|nr:hypothetical protein PHYBOEH_005681 [Phytophthora boehmeriae]